MIDLIKSIPIYIWVIILGILAFLIAFTIVILRGVFKRYEAWRDD